MLPVPRRVMSNTATPPRRSRGRRALVWGARIVGVFVALVAVGVGVAYGVTARRFATPFVVPQHELGVAPDPSLVARGRHVAQVRGCTDCHGEQFGGRAFIDDPAIGRLVASNLTNGGRGLELDATDWERAVRHGVHRDGTPLMFMPAQDFVQLSDRDIAALIAYARSLPAVADSAAETRVGPVARVLYLAGMLPLVPAELVQHAATHAPPPAEEATPEFGKFMASTCVGCHGDGLSGGRLPGTPASMKAPRNITPDSATGIGRWSEDEFITALATGRRPDGSMIDATQMPIRMTAAMTETERRAIYRYLRTIPPKPFGNR